MYLYSKDAGLITLYTDTGWFLGSVFLFERLFPEFCLSIVQNYDVRQNHKLELL